MTKFKYRIYQVDLNIALEVVVNKQLTQEQVNSMGMSFINGSEWFVDCGSNEEYEFEYELISYQPHEKSWLDNLNYGSTIPLLPEDKGP